MAASPASAGFLNFQLPRYGLHQWAWGTYVLGPVLGAVIGFNLYNLLFVETELAEVAESKTEKSKTSTLNATLTQSEVEAAGDVVEVDVEVSKRSSRSSSSKPRSSAAKKTPAKRKSSSSSRRRNPNAA